MSGKQQSGSALDPWSVDAADFPAAGNAEEKLAFLLNYAVLAPSILNSQPWRFRLRGATVELIADRSLRFPVMDPDARELTISCGAALLNLRIAARSFGQDLDVATGAGPGPLDPLAVATVREGAAATAEEVRLRDCILQRRTYRNAFAPEPIPARAQDILRAAAESEGGMLFLAQEPEHRAVVAQIVGEAERAHLLDEAYRRELETWTRCRIAESYDRESEADQRLHRAIKGHGPGPHAELSVAIGAGTARSFARPEQAARHQAERAARGPLLALLATAGDQRADWLAAGQSLERVLLAAVAEGLAASYLNGPTELPQLRRRLTTAFAGRGAAQVLLRLGYGQEPTPATPRRPVSELLIDDADD